MCLTFLSHSVSGECAGMAEPTGQNHAMQNLKDDECSNCKAGDGLACSAHLSDRLSERCPRLLGFVRGDIWLVGTRDPAKGKL